MPLAPVSVEVTYTNAETTVFTPATPGVELVIGGIFPSGGGGGTGTVAISPDAGNMIERRPNGLYAATKLASANW